MGRYSRRYRRYDEGRSGRRGRRGRRYDEWKKLGKYWDPDGNDLLDGIDDLRKFMKSGYKLALKDAMEWAEVASDFGDWVTVRLVFYVDETPARHHLGTQKVHDEYEPSAGVLSGRCVATFDLEDLWNDEGRETKRILREIRDNVEEWIGDIQDAIGELRGGRIKKKFIL